MSSGVQFVRGPQESETFGQRAYACLGRAARYMIATGHAIDRGLSPKSLTHLFFRHIAPIAMAANAGAVLVANRFVHFSESPIAMSVLAVGGMIGVYLVKKIKNESLLWDSIGKDPELVKICLEAGVDPNSICEGADISFPGMNLHKACAQLDIESLKHLIEAGGDVQTVDNKGRTALLGLCDSFIHPTDLNRRAVVLQIATALIDQGIDLTKMDEKGNTALHLAIQFGHLEVARKILQTGFDSNVRNLEQQSPLMLLCDSFMGLQQFGHSFFVDLGLDLIDLLVEYQADVNALGNDHVAALHMIACDAGASKTVKRLLDHHADPNIKGPYGATPLITACINGSIGAIKVLLKGGADVNAQFDEWHPGAPHDTALDIALHPDNPLEEDLKNQIIQLLLEAGAQAKKHTDSPLLERVAMKFQKKYSPTVLRFRETHGRLPESVTQYT